MPPSPDDLSATLKRLINGTATEADLAALRRALLAAGEGSTLQIGEYNVHIGQGQNIQIGDRFYAIHLPPTLSPDQAERLTEAYRATLAENWSVLVLESGLPRYGPEQKVRVEVLPLRGRQAHLGSWLPQGKSAMTQKPPAPSPQPIPLGEALQQARHLVLLGEPGSGKSTILQYIGLCLVRGEGATVGIAEPLLPVRLHLPEWETAFLEKATLADALAEAVRHTLARPESDRPIVAELLKCWQAQPGLLLLLDGLDELSEPGCQAARERIRAFLANYGATCRVIVASRPTGYLSLAAEVKEMREFLLKPFEKETARALHNRPLLPDDAAILGPSRSAMPQPLAQRIAVRPTAMITLENADEVTQLVRWGKGTVDQVAYSPDGRLLAVASSLGIYLYNAQTLAEVRFFETSAWAKSVTFSPDGALLASGLKDHTVCIWDMTSGVLLCTLGDALQGHNAPVTSVVFSPDGTILASGSEDKTVRLWRVTDGALLRTLQGHMREVRSVAFSPDGTRLASGSADRTVRLWRTADGAAMYTLRGHMSEVHDVVFSPNGQMLVSAASDKTVRLWRISDGMHLRTLEGHTDFVLSVAFNNEGTLLASGSADKTIRLWRLSDGTLLQTMKGHKGSVGSVTFSPDGTLLASSSNDGVCIWRVVDGMLLHLLEGYAHAVSSVAFSASGTFLASADWGGTIRIWLCVMREKLLHTLEGHTLPIWSVAFSPDEMVLASGSWDGTMQLWLWGSGIDPEIFMVDSSGVFAVTFSPDGNLLALGLGDGTIQLWNKSVIWTQAQVLDGHKDSVLSLAFSPDGTMLASASRDNAVRLWHATDGKPLHKLEGHRGPVASIAFSPDGALLASGSTDGTIRLWRTSGGILLRTFEGHMDYVWSVAFSPDGNILASGAGGARLKGNSIQMWCVQDGRPLCTLLGHMGPVQSVIFSPDGTLLASGSLDGTVRLWGIP